MLSMVNSINGYPSSSFPRASFVETFDIHLLKTVAITYRGASILDEWILAGYSVIMLFTTWKVCSVLWAWRWKFEAFKLLQAVFDCCGEHAIAVSLIIPLAYSLMKVGRDKHFNLIEVTFDDFYYKSAEALSNLSRIFNRRKDRIGEQRNLAVKERFKAFCLINGLLGSDNQMTAAKAMVNYQNKSQIPAGSLAHVFYSYNYRKDSSCSVAPIFDNEEDMKRFGRISLMDHPRHQTKIDQHGKIRVPYGYHKNRVRWFFDRSTRDTTKVRRLYNPPPNMPRPRLLTLSLPCQSQKNPWKQWVDTLRYGDSTRRVGPTAYDNPFGRWLEIIVDRVEAVSMDFEPGDRQGIRSEDYPDPFSEPAKYKYPLGGRFQRMLVNDNEMKSIIELSRAFNKKCTNYARDVAAHAKGFKSPVGDDLKPVLEPNEEDELEDINNWDFSKGPRPMKRSKNTSILSTFLPEWLHSPATHSFLPPSKYEDQLLGHVYELDETYPLPTPLPKNIFIWPRFFGTHKTDRNGEPLEYMADPDLIEVQDELRQMGIRLPNMTVQQPGMPRSEHEVNVEFRSWLKAVPKADSRPLLFRQLPKDAEDLEAIKEELRGGSRKIQGGFKFGEKDRAQNMPEIFSKEWFERLLPPMHSAPVGGFRRERMEGAEWEQEVRRGSCLKF